MIPIFIETLHIDKTLDDKRISHLYKRNTTMIFAFFFSIFYLLFVFALTEQHIFSVVVTLSTPIFFWSFNYICKFYYNRNYIKNKLHIYTKQNNICLTESLHNLYALNINHLNKPFKIIQLDFKEFVPKNINYVKSSLSGYNISSQKNDAGSIVYLALPEYARDYYELTAYLHYRDTWMKKTQWIHFYVEIKYIKGEMVATINNAYIEVGKIFWKHERNQKSINIDKSYFLFYTFGSMRWFNCIEAKDFPQNIYDRRKYVLHDGDFGCGKTVYDTSLILLSENEPIAISPWEEMCDHDLLFLIFKKLRERSIRKRFKADFYLFICFIFIISYW